jgi:hypothetical protein
VWTLDTGTKEMPLHDSTHAAPALIGPQPYDAPQPCSEWILPGSRNISTSAGHALSAALMLPVNTTVSTLGLCNMGNSASKAVSKVGGAAARRQYPSTPNLVNSSPAPSAASPAVKSAPAAPVKPSVETAPPSDGRSEHIELDARDPQFGSALRQVGAARPITERKPNEDYFPTSSQPMHSGPNIFPSQPQNPAMLLVQARRRLAQQVESELEDQGRPSFAGRTLISAQEIRQALTSRDDAGRSSQEVEKQLRLKPGILDQLVAKGVVGNV